MRKTYKHLNTVQKGSFGEAYSKMAFVLEGFEVYDSEYDDRGVDFVIRNKSGKFFSIQVKATDDSSNSFIKENKFQKREDFIFCAVRIIEGKPPSLYIARGLDRDSDIKCLNYNPNGGSSGPYYEIRFSGIYETQLTQIKFETYVNKIRE